LWLGIIALYLGFSAVLGVLWRWSRQRHEPGMDSVLVWAHLILLVLPSLVLVMRLPDWPLWFRTTIALIGIAVITIGFKQPDWTPEWLWKRTFGHLYFTLSMSFAAIWGLVVGINSSALPPLLIGITAAVAGLSSLYTAPRIQ
jgi:hypothetical protein